MWNRPVDRWFRAAIIPPAKRTGRGFPGSSSCAVKDAPVAELVDAPDSKSGTARCAGSSPARGTTFERSALTMAEGRAR